MWKLSINESLRHVHRGVFESRNTLMLSSFYEGFRKKKDKKTKVTRQTRTEQVKSMNK